MTFTLIRQQLYELVWSEPMQRLARQIGISDMAIAKHCRNLGVPVSQRGYCVHNDDVAWFEDRNELLLDIGAEASAIDRTVEDAEAVSRSQRSAPRKASVRRVRAAQSRADACPFVPTRATGPCWS